jgi:small-conductance mechanosensitive channel
MTGFQSIGQQIDQLLASWPSLIPLLLLIIVGGSGVIFLQRLLRRYFTRLVGHAPVSPGTLLILRRGISTALWVVFGLLLLRQVGVQVDGIWTILVSIIAVIGVGLLAIWSMVSNITASLFIWIWRPYELGETIELLPNNIKGRAVDRSLMFTTLREADGSLLMVPNNQFFQNTTRRWPNQARITDFEAWATERAPPTSDYASALEPRNQGAAVDSPKDDPTP